VLPAVLGVAVLFTVAVSAIPIRLAGAAPAEAFRRYVALPLTSSSGILEVLLAATPLIFTGAAVLVAFRVGYWNIGAEGQYLLGAVVTTWFGTRLLPDLPVVAAITVGLVGGALGGAAWALLPAMLKRHAGIDEVVTTLVLNPVALLVVQGLLNGPWRNSRTQYTESDVLGEGYVLPRLFDTGRLHLGFVIAIAVVLVLTVVFGRTATGLRMTAAGNSSFAARCYPAAWPE
jgi:simple sugar transport system permease protein